ncbi:MAG: hypothetical protein LRS49_03820 [Desulfurococcales archaeon]|nr:hypothetical protein [Desulfurococcales archaeon]
MTLTSSYPLAASLYLARSVLMNAGNPLLSAYTLRLVPPERRGVASAFLNLAWTVPAGAGRAVGGFLLDVDLELPLRATAAVYAAAIAYLHRAAKPGLASSTPRADGRPVAAAVAGARRAV